MMNRLTAEERRRIWRAQQRARDASQVRLDTEAPANAAPFRGPSHVGFRRLAKAAMIVALLGGGLLASKALEFNLPASLVEALLPRL
jgi:hypothetical protein